MIGSPPPFDAEALKVKNNGVADTAGKKTILIVDDARDDVHLVNLMFKRSRILNPVQAVGTIAEAIRYLNGEGPYADRDAYPFPALMFLDLRLPDGSGFDVLRWIRTHQIQAPFSVVVLSGSDVNAFNKAYELGAHSFLVKPLRFADFENTVRHLRGIKLTSSPAGHLVELA